jgi:hypothetical protein
MGVAAVTLSDTADLPEPCRGIMVTVSGDVKITGWDGVAGVLPGLATGVIHPCFATRIWSNGTTATGVVAIK